jgi:type VI secretion system protein ImpG
LDSRSHEYHVVPDRTRPMDYEVHTIREVMGYGASQTDEQEFLPFYGSKTGYRHREERSYYAIRREARVLSARQRRQGARSSYIGSECFVSLVDANQAPYRSDLKQLGLQLLCTNRDLPLLMPIGVADTDFFLQTGAPVQSVRCVAGPTRPRPSVASGETAWKLINHLSLNYLSIADTSDAEGAAALRELLSLYAEYGEITTRKQIDGVLAVKTRNTVRRIDTRGPIVFGRGLEIRVRLDETAFEGSGVFLLGSVLEHFFARYTSINTFTETVVDSNTRGEVIRWPIRIGSRHTL